MKKVLLFIFIVFLFSLSKSEKTEYAFLYTEDNYYNNYLVNYNHFSINDYLDKFKNIDAKDYKIISITFEYNYNNNLNKYLNNIEINGGNYIEALEEYIIKYESILDNYDMESEISKIQGRRMNIKQIKIYTTKDIYSYLINN